MSSPRPHWASRRSRSWAKPSASRCITVATSASASSTAPRGSSTNRTWISSQRDWKLSESASSGAASPSVALSRRGPGGARGAGGPPAARAAGAGVGAGAGVRPGLGVVARRSRVGGRGGRGGRAGGRLVAGARGGVIRAAGVHGGRVVDRLARRAAILDRLVGHDVAVAHGLGAVGGNGATLVEVAVLALEALGRGLGLVAARRRDVTGAQTLVGTLHLPHLPYGLVVGCAAAAPRRVGGRLVRAEELDKQRAEVHHRLAQVLGARLSRGRTAGDVVGGAVVLDDLGVVDGDIGRALVELVGDGVAAVAHDLHHERVGLADGGRGLVDEATLGVAPAVGVAVARGGLELADLELVAPLTALAQLGLGFAAVAAALLDRGLVFGAEALLQLLRSPLAHENDRSDDQGDHDDRHDHDDHVCLPPVDAA